MVCTSELLFSEQLEKAGDMYVDIYRNIDIFMRLSLIIIH